MKRITKLAMVVFLLLTFVLPLTACGSTRGLEFELVANGTGYSVSAGTATSRNIVIPSHYNDLPVVHIAENAFSYNRRITSVKIPNSVTSVGDSAFRGCTSLTSIIFEADSQLWCVTSRTFAGCTSLTSILIPSGVTLN